MKLGRPHFQRYSGWFLIIALSFAALLGLGEYLRAGWLVQADNLVLDQALRLTASQKPATHTMVIDIDERSLAALGQWPWPRYQVANLIQKLADAKPASIGLDLMFPEADRTSLQNIQSAFKRDFGLNIAITGAPPGLSDNDGFLGYTMAKTHAVGSKYFLFDHWTHTETSDHPKPVFLGDTQGLHLKDAPGMLKNTEEIAAQTLSSGFINTQPDADGSLRRLTLFLTHDKAIHANLALANWMQSAHAPTASISRGLSGPSIQVGDTSIPIDDDGTAVLRYNGGPNLYPSISALDILNGSFRPEDLRDKIVFIGSSAAALSDLHNTAFDPYFPGLKIQAAMAESIATGRFVRIPSFDRDIIVLECLVLGAVISMLYTNMGGAFSAVTGSFLAAVIPCLIALMLFTSGSIFVSPAVPLVLTAFLVVVFSVIRFAIEQRLSFINMQRLQNARQVTIESMAAVAETRDPETGAHIKRTQHYVKAIAEALAVQGKFREILTPDYISTLFISAPLHDIGKVGVPDHILLKPGKLTPEELVIMRRHAEFGRSIIMSTASMIEGDNYLVIAGEIAATHHEKWDGTGYPMGLAGEDIPLSGRIMAVADIYDALISKRCYKEPFPHGSASELIRSMRGTTFDPVVLDAFFSIEEIILEIARTYADATPAAHAANPTTEQLRQLLAIAETPALLSQTG